MGHRPHAYQPVRADQTPMQAGGKESFEKRCKEDYSMYTATICKHLFRGLLWDDEGWEERGQEAQQDRREFHLHETGQNEAKVHFNRCAVWTYGAFLLS